MVGQGKRVVEEALKFGTVVVSAHADNRLLKDIEIAQKPPQEYENKNGGKTTAAPFPCPSSSHNTSQ